MSLKSAIQLTPSSTVIPEVSEGLCASFSQTIVKLQDTSFSQSCLPKNTTQNTHSFLSTNPTFHCSSPPTSSMVTPQALPSLHTKPKPALMSHRLCLMKAMIVCHETLGEKGLRDLFSGMLAGFPENRQTCPGSAQQIRYRHLERACLRAPALTDSCTLRTLQP